MLISDAGCGCAFVDPKQKCKPLDTSLGEDGFRVKGGTQVKGAGSYPYQVSLIIHPLASFLFFWISLCLLWSEINLVSCSRCYNIGPLGNFIRIFSFSLKKTIHQYPITILPMFLADRFSHKNETVFRWVQGVFIGWAYGKPPGLSNQISFDSIQFLIEKLQKPFDSILF
jgi:hypothetical protein